MRFSWPVAFEIPDEVWDAIPTSLATLLRESYYVFGPYRKPSGQESDLFVRAVPLLDIEPPLRSPGMSQFNDERLLSILKAIVQRQPLPAVLGLPTEPGARHPFELIDGFHRFYASAAVGFTHVPVAVRPGCIFEV